MRNKEVKAAYSNLPTHTEKQEDSEEISDRKIAEARYEDARINL